MNNLTLTVGNYNYSSWSMRPWVALTAAGVAFDTQRVWLDTPTFKAQVAANPAGKVPFLNDGEFVVWETLAIIEYAYETHPAIWPAERQARARARSLCAQMHSGFTGLRSAMPMNIEAKLPAVGHTDAALADAASLFALWADALAASNGPFLFGAFCAADAYFSPVIMRLNTHAVPMPPVIAAYCAAVTRHPAVQAWVERALDERVFVAADEPYRTAEQAGY